jgi:hypothetical protein
MQPLVPLDCNVPVRGRNILTTKLKASQKCEAFFHALNPLHLIFLYLASSIE